MSVLPEGFHHHAQKRGGKKGGGWAGLFRDQRRDGGRQEKPCLLMVG